MMNQLSIKTPAYISLNNILQPIAWFDQIMLEKTKKPILALSREKGYAVATNRQNPIYKVAAALRKKCPNPCGVKISIKKMIPTQCGLNTTLSNAAGVLRALNKLWGLKWPEEKLIGFAKTIDPHLSKLMRIKGISSKNVIIVIPKNIVLDREWLRSQKKDPETSAYQHFPDMKWIEQELKKAGCRKVGMSGFGPAIVGFLDA